MPENCTGSTSRRPSYWTITGEGFVHSNALTIDPDGDGEALAVFGFREEADLFLHFLETGGGWRVREATAGEIVCALHESYAGIERVVIDPLPPSVRSATGIVQPSMSRADFTRLLVRTTRAAPGPLPALANLRP